MAENAARWARSGKVRGVPDTAPGRKSFWWAFASRRVASVTLLSLSSGLPFGVVETAIPAWLAASHVDIKTIGLLSLAKAPWGFKFLWSPLMDRVVPPLLGRRRGWVLLTQLVLAAGTFALGLQLLEPTPGQPPPALIAGVAALTLLIAFASASQDIAYDAYAVEVLRTDEQGAAVGVRGATYRVGMWLGGNIALSLAPVWGWQSTFFALAAVYLALLPVTVWAPEPEVPVAPPASLRAAVWEPFVGFLARPRALEIAAFVLLFRIADSVAGAHVTPFLIQKGYAEFDVGVARGTVGMIATFVGTFVGGALTSRLGVTRALWLAGVLQAVSNIGYAVVAQAAVNPPLMYAAIAIEAGCTGLGWGAFGVLLLRLTDRRFSATQYALFSSLVGLGRTFVGPPAGVLADALGWRDFFLATVPMAIPGMVLLARFAPWGQEPRISSPDAPASAPGAAFGAAALWSLGAAVFALATLASLGTSVAMGALKASRLRADFSAAAAFRDAALPPSLGQAGDLTAALAFGLVFGVGTAAALAARGRRG